ncbi:MAG: signal peptidase I [Tenericutes bacterium]|jgi:signal peptidase|nr:signal peptidase I [Mycoplasmatota bacterium]
MSKLKDNKVFNIVKIVLFYLIIAFLSLFIFMEIFAPRQTVKVFGFKPYYVMTQSMEPVLEVHDLIVVKNFDVEDLEEEDIITFYADIDYNGEKEIVTHYIYSIAKNASGDYVIRTHRYYEDDQNIAPDPWFLSKDDVLGLYNFHVPLLGYVIQFLQSPFGIAALVVNGGIIAAIVILIKREKKEKVIDKEEIE